uniref:Uncharacterized protein n=1 Tax=Anopheles culicifacies TaxID=139723 RepID=A0A182MQP7_9DIPT
MSLATIGPPACKAVAVESPEPASLLRPRDVNPHPYQNAYDGIAIFDRNLITNSEKFTENLLNQGPIQFPRLREGSTVNALPYPYETLALKERQQKMVRFSGADSQTVKPAYQALAKHAARVLGKSYAVEDIDTYNEASTNVKKNYVFSYAVKDTASGDDFSHTQQQQQDGAVKGSYKVQLPDGRMQIVKYIADNNGYRADVTYENEPAGLGVPASPQPGPAVQVATGPSPNPAAYQTYYAKTPVQQPQQYLAQIRPARLYYAAPNSNQIPTPFYPTQLRANDVKIHSYNTAPHAGAVIASTTTQATPASGAYLATFPASGNLAYIATSAANGPIGTVQLQSNGGGVAVPVTAIPLSAYRDINVPPPPQVQPIGVAFASAGRRTTVYADGARVLPQGTLQQTIYHHQQQQQSQPAQLDYGYVQIPVDNRVYKRDTDRSTENILERAEKRAAALGITSTSKFPLSEFNYEADKQSTGASPKKKSTAKKHSAPKPPSSTTVSTRTATDGERTTTVDIGGQDNCDVALEINITTSANLQVDLGLKELENDGSVKKQWEHNIVRTLEGEKENSAEAKSVIRDQSRNQLQRLGTLYSETQDLSSPVHRTEARFHEDMKQSSKPKPKLAKLAMLADSINNWEDDTSHPDITHHRETIVPGRENKSPTARRQSPRRVGGTGVGSSSATAGTGATPKKYPAPNPPKSILSPQKPPGNNGGEPSGASGKQGQTKSLKWDQKVMDTLESQGFQRRESTTSKLVYDYKEDKNGRKVEIQRVPASASVGNSTSRERSTTQVDQAEEAKKSTVVQQKKPTGPSGFKPTGGLVSGRAAMFEKSSGRRQSILKPGQKDPAEMSLKERMAIFEKNKGAALVPKAAFGISPSIRQITGEKEGGKSVSSGSGPMSCAAIQGSGFGSITQQARTVAPASPQSKPKTDHGKPAPKIESKATGCAIRNTVEALMSDTSTISQSEISEEIRRMRQQEMDMLLNRFTKPADMSSDTPSYEQQPIPSAPPMPPEGYLTASAKKKNKQSFEGHPPAKRRSDGSNDSPGVMAALDDVKRIRVAPTAKDGRMYPALSDIETTATESGDEGAVGDDYTTATVSGSESSERAYRTCYGDVGDAEHAVEEEEEDYDDEEEDHERRQYEVDEDDDSFMYSDDDEEANMANVSLGREILQAVKLNDRRTSRGRRQSQDWNHVEEEVSQKQTTKPRVSFSLNRSNASDGSDQLGDSDLIDACLEEAFVDEGDEDSEAFDTPVRN